MFASQCHGLVIDLNIRVDLMFRVFASNDQLFPIQWKRLPASDDHQARLDWPRDRPAYDLLHLFERADKLARRLVARVGRFG